MAELEADINAFIAAHNEKPKSYKGGQIRR